MGIHRRTERTFPNYANSEGESEIPGPSGQHSNTPFRRNRSATIQTPTFHNKSGFFSTSTNSVPQSTSSSSAQKNPSGNSKPASPSFLRRRISLSDTDKEHSDSNMAVAIENRPKYRRNSSTEKRPSNSSLFSHDHREAHDDGNASDTNGLKTSRSKSMYLPETKSLDQYSSPGTTDKEAIPNHPAVAVGSHRTQCSSKKKSPSRQRSKDSKDPSSSHSSQLATTALEADSNKEHPFNNTRSMSEEYEDEEDDDSSDDEDVDNRGGDIDAEEDEHFDDGDSDVGIETSKIVSDLNGISLSVFSGSTQEIARSLEKPVIDEDTPHNTRRECEDEGKGVWGIEGSQLAPLLRASLSGLIHGGGDLLKAATSATTNIFTTEKTVSNQYSADLLDRQSVITFGPGASQQHPWTLRKDSGINSRLQDGSRGDEIYYVGVIDILQQYNMRKLGETIVKVKK